MKLFSLIDISIRAAPRIIVFLCLKVFSVYLYGNWFTFVSFITLLLIWVAKKNNIGKLTSHNLNFYVSIIFIHESVCLLLNKPKIGMLPFDYWAKKENVYVLSAGCWEAFDWQVPFVILFQSIWMELILLIFHNIHIHIRLHIRHGLIPSTTVCCRMNIFNLILSLELKMALVTFTVSKWISIAKSESGWCRPNALARNKYWRNNLLIRTNYTSLLFQTVLERQAILRDILCVECIEFGVQVSRSKICTFYCWFIC